jgi:hypothetical protein
LTGGSEFSRQQLPKGIIVRRNYQLAGGRGAPQHIDEPQEIDSVEALQRIVQQQTGQRSTWSAQVERQK